MYCLLGHIAFELLNAPSTFDEKHQSNFAEHATIEGKPKLQATGNALIEYELSIKLHHVLGEVNTLYQQLLEAQASQKAQALIFGWSDFKGYFVITQISSQTLFTDEHGEVLARELSVSLKEFVGETSQDLLGAALQFGGMSPLGSILPTGLINTVSQMRQLLTKAVQVYRSVARIVDVARTAFSVIQKIIDNPALVLNYLPSLLNGFSSVLGNMQWLISREDAFTSAATVLHTTQSFVGYMKGLFNDLNAVYTGLSDIYYQRSYQDATWLDWSLSKLNAADRTIDVLAPITSKMSAWIVLREDEVAYEPTLS